jgi:hypothetical protein
MEATSGDSGDQLYEVYGKPLEAGHWGEYVAISANGESVVRSSLLEVAEEAAREFGPGVFIFKVGERAVGKWR